MKNSKLFRSKGAAELNQLYSFVLLIVLVGMVIGVGVITVDKIGSSTSYKRIDYNDTSVTNPLINQTLVALDFGNITKVSKVINATSPGSEQLDSSCFTINTTSGQFRYDNVSLSCATLAGSDIEIIYDYKDFNTETKKATSSVVTEIANIATDWIGLIITVFVLAIILFLVVSSFSPGNFGGRGN